MIRTVAIILMIINISATKNLNIIENELNDISILYLKQDYQSAEQRLNSLLNTNDPILQFTFSLELADLYFDKLNKLDQAESIYNSLIEKFPKHKNIADIYYRLGVIYEKQEKYLAAAQMYELVATQYHKSKYAQDALDAIERCFKKNYQDIVAKIDGFPITRIEFDERMSYNPGAYEKFSEKQKLLDEMIAEQLMYREAKKLGLDQLADFKKRLAENRTNIMFQHWYQQEIVNKVKVSDKEKKAYYKKHKTEFIIPEQASAREILVKTKEEADSLYNLITTYNLPFDSVAQAVSLSPTKSAGGDMGYFRRGTHPQEVENVIFKLKPKSISKPFYSESKAGYLIIKLEEIRPKKERKYNEVAVEIENRLRSQKIDETFKTRTDAFKKACAITIDELALKDNRDTIAIIDGLLITKETIDEYLNRIPPFYRSEFETVEGKKRILDQIILEKTWLKQLEKEKYWLLNAVFSQVDNVRRQLLINDIRKQEVNDKIFISESELKSEYKRTIDEFKTPKQVRAREITVNSESLAQQIRKLALTGRIPFDSLAREYSIAPNKRVGGDMGFFSAGSKPKEIEEVAFKLPKGQISQIIKQNDSTYTIIKIEEIKEASTKPFEDVKMVIQNRLRQNKDKELYEQFINKLRKEHQIETFLVEEKSETETPETKPAEQK
ncbi:MAG: peptidylprolyl isomerase [candidate division WOR-3 bacterium]|nr:peptidylprolyl isomerase [candidate division WOR-3 bacterium]